LTASPTVRKPSNDQLLAWHQQYQFVPSTTDYATLCITDFDRLLTLMQAVIKGLVASTDVVTTVTWSAATSPSFQLAWERAARWRLAPPTITPDLNDEPFTQTELDEWMDEGIQASANRDSADTTSDAAEPDDANTVSALFDLDSLSFSGSARERRRRNQ
jgi:hypothetical protein